MTSVWMELGAEPIEVGSVYPHRHRGIESATFRYADNYLTDPRAYAIDPHLPLLAGSLQTPVGASTFGAFGDTSPDRWGRNLLLRDERRRALAENRAPRSHGEFDLILGVRDDLRQGNLRFRQGDTFLAPPESGVPLLTDLPALLQAADRVPRDEASAADLALLIHAGSSLGGARPKAHVLDADGSLSIAKFPSPAADTWDVMAWEQVALDLAVDAGCDVPVHQLIVVGRRNVLIVKRFDRRSQMRIGYVSALTMLEARDAESRSYLEIADVIEQRSASTADDLAELWRRMALTVLISNTDDHLRNHGFLHVRGDTWRLSPVFDINPNPSGRRDLSTAIEGAETRATVAHLMRVADYFRLPGLVAVRVLAEVLAACSRWRDAARRNGLSERAISEMAPAFEHEAAVDARALVGQSR